MTAMRRAWPCLRALLGVAILAALVWRLGTGAFLDGLRRILDPIGLIAALGLGLLTTVFSAARWCLVARRIGLPLPLGVAVADCYLALFLNGVLPGGMLGDVHRALRHGRIAGDIGRGVRAVVLERTANQVVVLVAGIMALYAEPSLLAVLSQQAVMTPLAMTSIALAGGCVAAALTARACRWWTDLRWRQTVATTMADARASLLARDRWPALAVLSAAALASNLVLFLVAARISGATASTPRLLPLVMLAQLAMGLPINVGGWGPREGVAALAFAAAGLTATLGLTTAVVYGALTFVASLPGAAILVGRRAWQAPPAVALDRDAQRFGASRDAEAAPGDQWREGR
jgi:glycosyltransferase 2 family protein